MTWCYVAAAAIFAGAVVSLAAGGWLGTLATVAACIGVALLLHETRGGTP